MEAVSEIMHDGRLPRAGYPGFIETVKDHLSTPYTAVKAAHKGLLNVFVAFLADCDPETWCEEHVVKFLGLVQRSRGGHGGRCGRRCMVMSCSRRLYFVLLRA